MMRSKRTFSEVDPSNPRSRPDSSQYRHKKHKISKAKNEDNTNRARKRARNIQRLLQKDESKLPANVQKDMERELAALQQRIHDAEGKKQRSKMIGKYHMVRFFGEYPTRLLYTRTRCH
jgi:hypothetical protein